MLALAGFLALMVFVIVCGTDADDNVWVDVDSAEHWSDVRTR